MIKVGQRVRFKQDEHDKRRTERADPSQPALVPGPGEVFVVKALIPWQRKVGKDAQGRDKFEDVVDEKGWANLGPDHPMVACNLLEPA